MSLSESFATLGPVIAASAISSVFQGMRLPISSACFLETFLTFFVVTLLLVAPGPAIAVPASAATSARTATTSAGDGLDALISLIDVLLP